MGEFVSISLVCAHLLLTLVFLPLLPASDELSPKFWQLVGDLSDQLAQNRQVTAALQAQVAEVKVSIHPPPLLV